MYRDTQETSTGNSQVTIRTGDHVQQQMSHKCFDPVPIVLNLFRIYVVYLQASYAIKSRRKLYFDLPVKYNFFDEKLIYFTNNFWNTFPIITQYYVIIMLFYVSYYIYWSLYAFVQRTRRSGTFKSAAFKGMKKTNARA